MGVLSIVQAFVVQVFNMFMQLLDYLIVAPGNTFNQIMTTWGQSFANFGILIPVIFVIIIGITGAIVYTFITMGKDISESMNVTDMIGAVE